MREGQREKEGTNGDQWRPMASAEVAHWLRRTRSWRWHQTLPSCDVPGWMARAGTYRSFHRRHSSGAKAVKYDISQEETEEEEADEEEEAEEFDLVGTKEERRGGAVKENANCITMPSPAVLLSHWFTVASLRRCSFFSLAGASDALCRIVRCVTTFTSVSSLRLTWSYFSVLSFENPDTARSNAFRGPTTQTSELSYRTLLEKPGWITDKIQSNPITTH